MEGESPPRETRLWQAMPGVIIKVVGMWENLQTDIQDKGDRAEQSLETANSMLSSF